MLKSGLLALALSLSSGAWAASNVVISSFTPQSVAESTNQIRAVFSEKMVALGVNPNADVFDISCSPQVQGTAKWDDEKSWSFNFSTKLYANKLPGGTRCQVSLKPSFKQAKKVSGKTDFSFKIDGPNILNIFPGDTNGTSRAQVSEDQVFVLQLDADADQASVLKNAYFRVDGVASAKQLRILTEAEKRSIMKSESFPEYSFDKELPIVMVQAREKFPSNKKISLVWGPGIKSTQSGLQRERQLVLPFETRPLLTAQFSCVRENAKADCSPFSAMEVTFSQDIPADMAKQIRLVSADGKVIPVQLAPSDKGKSYVGRVVVPALVKEKQSFRLEMPQGIKDDSGRPLANQSSFPLTVKTAEFPPLAKFAADFGILEAKQAPVLLPATLRNLEPQVSAQSSAKLTGASARLTAANFPEVVKWMKALDIRQSSARSFEKRDVSVFDSNKTLKPVPFTVPLSQNGKAFEVVGVPLPGPGFYVVELQSRMLGRSLMGQDKTMYVPTGALVTNMVVHSKFGRESSLFWVTALDSGAPVSGAQVVVHDCKGKALVSGSTDGNGVYKYEGELNAKIDVNACRAQSQEEQVSYKYSNGFFVSAQKGDDFTFTHSSWNEGIEAWRFGGINQESPTWGGSKVLAHSVLDRTLLRAGETVSMKHFVRIPTGQGFKAMAAEQLPNQVEIAHVDTDTRYVAEIKWENGAAVSQFAIPKEAKLGLYSVRLLKAAKDASGKNVATTQYDTATFQVMEFKVPLMKGEISFPANVQKLVQPGQVEAQVSVKYQDGGPASNEPVKFRYTVNRNAGLWFTENFNYMSFGQDKVVEKQTRSSDNQESNEKTIEIPLRLDKNGSSVVTIPNLRGLDAPKSITTQLEFTDKNSETQNVARTVNVYPSSRLVAVDIQSSGGSDRLVKFRLGVSNLKGEPIAGVRPDLELFEEVTYTHKTRMVGGFYSSESFTDIKRKSASFKCVGMTDKKGLVNCEVVAPDSGNFIVQATVADADGNRSYGNDYAYVRGMNRAWFPSDNNDRMDLMVEKKDLQAGETAEMQVQMPFADATVLVTVEREGIVDYYVKRLSTTDPRIKLPMKEEYAPNVYVSVMAVRGRIGGAGNEPTATVDLGKPSYKVGLTSLNVNWKKNALNVSVKPSKDTVKPAETTSVEVTILDGQKTPVANAEFALAVVDEGLLQLAKNQTWDLLKAMMGERALEVETATAQMQVVGKRHFGLKARPTGGDGGQAPTRELFDTLVTWVPRVTTDANGRAVVPVKMNDSLSKFRVVAIAHSGLGRFGMGESSIVTQKELSLSPALGQITRNGDSLSVEISARNATKQTYDVTVSGKAIITYADGRTEVRDLGSVPAQFGSLESKGLSLGKLNVPDGAVKVTYEIAAKTANGEVVDSIRLNQDVKPSLLVRTWSAQMDQVGSNGVSVNVNLPQEAVPNKGGVKVSLLPTLAGSLDTVVDNLANYPFKSLEYDISRAVALGDKKLWDAAMSKLPSHLDGEGLVMYYPSASTAQGSDVLTAYVLSLSQYSGLEIPQTTKDKMVAGLISFVEGRARVKSGDTQADIYIRRVNAIEALARMGVAQPTWLTSLPQVAPEQVPTWTVTNLVSIYANMKGASNAQANLAKNLEVIRNRLTRTGTSLGLAGYPTPWYMMTSTHSDQLQLILVLSSNANLANQWHQEIPLLVKGGILMMSGGAWNMTTANAYGVLALKAYAKVFEPVNVTGQTEVALDNARKSFDWATSQKGGAVEFGWPSTGTHRVDMKHQGTGAPWSIVAVNAAVQLKSKVERNIEVVKTVSPQQATYKKGDVVTVTLKIKPQRDMGFISLLDPVPAGAKILGSGLDNDTQAGPDSNAWPDYQELSYEGYRASYSWVPGTGIELTYKVQLNNAGTFKLPATRVEAIYMPENFAEVPNTDWTVVPQ